MLEAPGREYPVIHGRDPHVARRRELLRLYPEIAVLRRPSLMTLLPTAALVALQLALAWWLRDAPVWLMLVSAWVVGAPLAFGLLVLIHEGSHGAISHKRLVNQLAGAFASLPLVIPFSPRFLRDHNLHHRFVGDYERDFNIPRAWEARMAGSGTMGKLLWFIILPFAYFARVQQTHDPRARRPRFQGWPTVALVAVQVVVIGALVHAGGLAVLGYLLASIYFALGPHPLAMRLVQEHGQKASGALTSSYYGVLNRIIFNLGYHVEHHDFPNIPWHRLPRLRAIAPEWYPGARAYPSRFRAFFSFLFQAELDLWDRCVRKQGPGPRGAEPTPAVDASSASPT